MSWFAGVSVLANGELCPGTESTVRSSADCGHHLLVVQDYSRTEKSISSRPFMVGGHCWLIHYCPNAKNQTFVSLRLSCTQGHSNEKPVRAKVVFSFIHQLELQNPVYVAQTECVVQFPLPGVEQPIRDWHKQLNSRLSMDSSWVAEGALCRCSNARRKRRL